MKDKLLKEIEKRQNELYSLLKQLININSESFGNVGNEKAVAEFIEKFFIENGMKADLYSPDSIEGIKENPDYMPGHNLENRPDVTGILKGKKSERRLMLMSHSDTVPIGDEKLWSFPPLSGELRDGKVWGRGACDDKYGIAVALFLMKLIKELGVELNYDLLFTAYSDEEYGGGNGALAACLKYKCDDYLNMDHKKLELCISAMGGGDVKIEIASDTPTSSCANTVKGVQILNEDIATFREARVKELLADEIYKDSIIPKNSVILLEAKAGDDGNDLDKGHIIVEYYTNKTEDLINKEFEELRVRADKRLAEIGFRVSNIEKTTRYFHYQRSDMDNNTVAEKLQTAAKEILGRDLVVLGAVLSDLSLILKYGSSKTVGFGIGRDFDVYGGAHQRDEFIECSDLLAFSKTIGTFLLDY